MVKVSHKFSVLINSSGGRDKETSSALKLDKVSHIDPAQIYTICARKTVKHHANIVICGNHWGASPKIPRPQKKKEAGIDPYI